MGIVMHGKSSRHHLFSRKTAVCYTHMFGGHNGSTPAFARAAQGRPREGRPGSPRARAELREKIKSGKVSLAAVLDSDAPIANRMKVSALIESLPGYGKAKAAKIMDELGISATRRVKGLGARQREQLIEALSK